MSDERVWLRHGETGGYFHCPAEAVDAWRELGWEPSDAPEEPNPVTAELLAWQAEQQATQEPAQPESITATAGPRHETEE